MEQLKPTNGEGPNIDAVATQIEENTSNLTISPNPQTLDTTVWEVGVEGQETLTAEVENTEEGEENPNIHEDTTLLRTETSNTSTQSLKNHYLRHSKVITYKCG